MPNVSIVMSLKDGVSSGVKAITNSFNGFSKSAEANATQISNLEKSIVC